MNDFGIKYPTKVDIPLNKEEEDLTANNYLLISGRSEIQQTSWNIF